jgi:hypothetical protein
MSVADLRGERFSISHAGKRRAAGSPVAGIMKIRIWKVHAGLYRETKALLRS